MRSMKLWVSAIFSAVLITACGDGSVRSPGLVGAGAIVSIALECRTPTGAVCDEPNAVLAGDFVNYRVIATFANGSTAVVTDRPNIRIAPATPRNEVTLTQSGENKGRARGNLETPAGNPYVIVASDTSNPDVQEVSAELTVVDSTPQQVQIFRDNSCTQPAAGTTVPSGAPLQLFARITFDSPLISSICRANDTRLSWASDPELNFDNSQVINNNGLFVGKNIEEELADFNVTAQFEGVQSADTLIRVQAAELIADSLRITPNARNIAIGGTVTYSAFATFVVDGGAPQEVQVTASTAFVADLTANADFLDAEAPNRLTGIAPTEPNLPVTVTGTFDGQTDTAIVNVLDADFGTLKLVPVGVAPFEAVGFFDIDGLQEEEIDELRQDIARDALNLGHDEDGRLPCSGAACPAEGRLAQHQTLVAAPPLAYAVFGFNEDDPDQQRGILLENLSLQCGGPDNNVLEVKFAADDDNVTLLRDVEIPGTVQNGDASPPERRPAETNSGISIVLAEGAVEGTTTIRARLGAEFNGGVGNGFNCRTFILGEEDEAGIDIVEDAEQEVRVGRFDNGTLIPTTSAAFNINTNYTCVGFLNAVELIEGADFSGREKLLSSLTYVYGEGEAAQQLIVNMNQSPRVAFSTHGGPANVDHLGCRLEDSESPRVLITNDLFTERGVMGATGPLSLGNDCALAVFNPPATGLAGFDSEDAVTRRAATVVPLPVADDDIVRGPSATGDINQLCGALAPLLTLPFGQFIDEQGAGLVTELLGLLGGILNPVLNNEIITGEVADGLNLLLEGLSDLVGVLFEIPGLGDLLDIIVCGIGLPACPDEPTEGITLLPSVLGVVQGLLDEFRAQWDAATGVQQPPATTNPGDPYRAPPPTED